VNTLSASVLAVAAGALLPAVSIASEAVPVPGKAAACRASAPMVLRPGAGQLVPLRLDLDALAGVRVDRTASYRLAVRSHYADGYAHTSHTVEKEKVRYVAAAHAGGGTVAVKAHADLAISSEGSKPKHHASSYSMQVDGLDRGGAGDVDHLPAAAVGVGAQWRVVLCNYTDDVPVMTTRVYTLRSIANGVVSTTFRDEITLDPGRTDLGPVDRSKHALHYALLSLSGTTTGSQRIPLANPLAQTIRSQTHAALSYAIGDTGEGLVQLKLQISSAQGA
jgi:hypothetical protein